MIGHFEEATRNCGRLKFRPQALKKNICVSVDQSRKRSGAPVRRDGGNSRLLPEKIAEQFAIGPHDPARSFSKEIEMLKRSDAEEFTGKNRCRAVKIVQPAHLPREIRLRQNPAASETAHAVSLR